MGNYDRADGGQLQRASCERGGGERGGGNVPSQIHRLMIELSSYVQPMYLFFQLSSSVLYSRSSTRYLVYPGTSSTTRYP